MRIFSTLLAASALTAPAYAGEFYFSTFGGANWKTDYASTGGDSSLVITPEVGYVVGGALGGQVDPVPGLRAELELSYRSNSLDGLWDGCSDFPVNGHDSTFAAMGNLVYDLPGVWGIKPYALAGVGYAARRISFSPTPDSWGTDGFGTERQGFAWQVGGGLDYEVSPGIVAGLGYRFFQGVAINREVGYGKNETFLEANGDNHSVLATIRFALN